jgi:hypothetical protein
MITLCEKCFDESGKHEVLTIVPMGPCAACGEYDMRRRGGTPSHLYRRDPRSPKEPASTPPEREPYMTRIHTDPNGVAVNAIHTLADGTDVRGHDYQILAGPATVFLNFQCGGVAANGVNGITSEALLAILIDRTQFLNSQFPCDENVRAASAMKEALAQFEARTAARQARGVEGREVE